MGLRRNILEVRDGIVKFVLSGLACHTRNVPSLCFYQTAKAIRGGWSATLPNRIRSGATGTLLQLRVLRFGLPQDEAAIP
jgi:hypothetical protein